MCDALVLRPFVAIVPNPSGFSTFANIELEDALLRVFFGETYLVCL